MQATKLSIDTIYIYVYIHRYISKWVRAHVRKNADTFCWMQCHSFTRYVIYNNIYSIYIYMIFMLLIYNEVWLVQSNPITRYVSPSHGNWWVPGVWWADSRGPTIDVQKAIQELQRRGTLARTQPQGLGYLWAQMAPVLVVFCYCFLTDYIISGWVKHALSMLIAYPFWLACFRWRQIWLSTRESWMPIGGT